MVKEEEYLLTNQEILGGLKNAIERGQTLKQAMMSFYQAGYKKEEIEDAARAYLYLQKGVSEEDILKKNGIDKNSQKKGLIGKKPNELNKQKELEKKNKVPEENKNNKNNSQKNKIDIKKGEKEKKILPTIEKTSVPTSGAQESKKKEEKKQAIQKISGYESKNPSGDKGKMLTIVLVITLIILLGILALVFLFKSELINFINSLFG